ncbi:hypothetical protein TELCIR_12741 [Teladorsagia circumcincta]|uniref:BHLH domain-containing protein n=1 Tax=Teladorsagia circumcincta TaxID=45464 RepID=A0A2G9U5N9_TELCI|nr:hypothetical protein TELCIR_12741 [Teladorsagia circumcincta]
MENDEFSNLARELPLARAISGQHIDKTTMVRLALSYIRLHKITITIGQVAFLRAEEMFRESLNRTALSLKGVSFYSIVHVDDADVVRKMHTEVFKLESYRPVIYRMLMAPGQHPFYVESNVFRYTSQSNKAIVDTITIVSSIL